MTAAAKSRNFKNYASTQAEEDSFDYVAERKGLFTTSVIGSIANIVKGALGAGVLSGHAAYLKAGVLLAIPLNVICGIYMGYCLYLLVCAAQILMKRTREPFLSYADVGEAAMMLFPNKKISKYAKPFRYCIDTFISLELFGACCAYQLIIAKSVKQLVEDKHETKVEGYGPYPNLRVYSACLIPIMIMICLIRHLKFLAPFALAANGVVAMCACMAIYYCFVNNPKFEGLKLATGFTGALQFVGMQVFSMSCAGLVIPIESNMKEPHKFGLVMFVGMGCVIFLTFSTAFFGYVAYLEESKSPITINFPMSIWAKILKLAICLMIAVTHAINFWVPFNLCWYYIKSRYTEAKMVKMELVYRAFFCIIIGFIAVTFPAINAIIGFIGCLCLSNMAFIWPNIIYLLVIYERPGLGKYKWRLWRAIFFLICGVFILCVGTVVNGISLVKSFSNPEK